MTIKHENNSLKDINSVNSYNNLSQKYKQMLKIKIDEKVWEVNYRQEGIK